MVNLRSYHLQQLSHKVVSMRFAKTAVSPYLGDSGCKTPLAWAISSPVSMIPRLESAKTGTWNWPGRGNSKFLNLERRKRRGFYSLGEGVRACLVGFPRGICFFAHLFITFFQFMQFKYFLKIFCKKKYSAWNPNNTMFKSNMKNSRYGWVARQSRLAIALRFDERLTMLHGFGFWGGSVMWPAPLGVVQPSS